MKYVNHPLAQAVLGGVSAAILVAAPLVDDGLVQSEVLAIASAFLAGSGLVRVKPTRRAK